MIVDLFLRNERIPDNLQNDFYFSVNAIVEELNTKNPGIVTPFLRSLQKEAASLVTF